MGTGGEFGLGDVEDQDEPSDQNLPILINHVTEKGNRGDAHGRLTSFTRSEIKDRAASKPGKPRKDQRPGSSLQRLEPNLGHPRIQGLQPRGPLVRRNEASQQAVARQLHQFFQG